MQISWLRVGLSVASFCLLAAEPLRANEKATTPPESRSVEIRTMFFQCDELPFDSQVASSILESPEYPSAAVGIMSMSGVLSKESADILRKNIRASRNTEVVEISPIFALSGGNAKIAMTQGVRYPNEYIVGNPPVAKTFETKEIGFTMEAESNIGEDGYTIDLTIKPKLTRLTGYQPLGGEVVDLKGKGDLRAWFSAIPAQFPKSDLVQPIFDTQEVTTHVTAYDGSSIVLAMSRKDPKTGEGRYTFLVVTTSIVPKS